MGRGEKKKGRRGREGAEKNGELRTQFSKVCAVHSFTYLQSCIEVSVVCTGARYDEQVAPRRPRWLIIF